MTRATLLARPPCSPSRPPPLPRSAQQADPSLLTLIRRIYGSGEFAAEPFGPARWLEDGTAYTTLEPSAGRGRGGPRPVRRGKGTGARSWWRRAS